MEIRVGDHQISLYDGPVEAGYVSFVDIDSATVEILHTVVDPSYRGQGLAKRLMDEVVVYLKANKKKAVPTCSFSAKYASALVDGEEYFIKR